MAQVNLVSDPKWAVDNDICPVSGCCGPLDTGWECNKCGYDAIRIALGRLGYIKHKFLSWWEYR